MKYSRKKQERGDKQRLVKLVLENPARYKDADIPELFYDKVDVSDFFAGKKRISLSDFQSAGTAITQREEYVTRLIQDLKKERILKVAGNGKLVIDSFEKAAGKGYISGDALSLYTAIHLSKGGKFKY